MAWDDIRKPYQAHIQNISKVIDMHSREHVITGDVFHLEAYHLLVDYITKFKQHIHHLESTQKLEK